MEPVLALLVGVFFAVAIYLLLSSSVVRLRLGVAILGDAGNLLIFTAGRDLDRFVVWDYLDRKREILG